jgi:hypothetical protein
MPLSYKQLGSTFISTPSVTIYSSGNTYAISSSSSGSGTIISGTNVGTGTVVFCGLTTTNNINDTLAFYNLSGGNEVGISINDSNEIVIVRGRTVVNTVSNLGGGAKVYTGITGTTLFARTISGAAGLTSALAGTGNILTRIAPTNTTANRFYIEDSTGVLTTNADFPIDATNGNISIDVAVSTTSRLLLASGTSSISQLRLTPFSSEPTNPSNGSIWFSTSGNTLKFEKDTTPTDFIFKDNNISLTGFSNSVLVTDTAGTLSIKYINSFGLFNALSSVTIANTASETSIISPVLTGSTTLLASTNPYNPELGVGRKYRFNAKGTIDTGDFVTLNIIIKLGSTIISSSSTITIGGGGPYSSEIEIDATFTIRNSGLIVGSGKILFLTGPPSTLSGDPVIFGIYSQDATIDTTSDKVFDCTAQFDTADPTNFITINESTLEILN